MNTYYGPKFIKRLVNEYEDRVHRRASFSVPVKCNVDLDDLANLFVQAKCQIEHEISIECLKKTIRTYIDKICECGHLGMDGENYVSAIGDGSDSSLEEIKEDALGYIGGLVYACLTIRQ